MQLHIEIILNSTFPCDFFGQYMRTFDDLSQVLLFVHQYELQCIFGKIVQNDPKLLPKWPKIVQNRPIKPKINHNDPKQSILAILGVLGHFGSFWIMLGNVGPFLGRFG